ncbi:MULTISPECIES: acetylxylan esterase [Acidobacterium]|nr:MULTISPECIES: acetylxylan esterase [Acidobacterium]
MADVIFGGVMRGFRSGCVLMVAGAMALAGASALAQSGQPGAPVRMTSEQMHARMMRLLGIEAMRPGPSGNPAAPNHANYDEATANPYPKLPDALTMDNGQKVTSAKMWWTERRPQIVADYAKYVYGEVPKHVPAVHWQVLVVDHEHVGFTPVVAREVVGTVDNSSDPQISVKIRMMVVTPANVKGPVPVLMMFGPTDFPAPNQPTRQQYQQINDAMKAAMEHENPALTQVFAEHPAWEPMAPPPFRFPQLNQDGGLPNTWELVQAGWGFAMLDPQSVQADNAAGLTEGIIGLVNHGQPRSPEQWGALRAWAWGASRGLDYLKTDPDVNGSEVGIEGVSRYGKAALLTMAMDQRFAMVLVGSSGKGGATPLRRNFGEAVETLASSEEYHWMAGAFLKYAAAKAKFAPMNASDIPVDSNDLIALCAPRLTFISYGIPERGDAKWLDQRGSWMATVAASKVWTLLGAKGLVPPVTENYRVAPMPPVNHGLLGGKLAWRQDDGGHTDAPNMIFFIHWAAKWFGYQPRG